MRILEMTFSTELGTSKTMRVYDAKADLTGAEVATCMDTIVGSNIFSGTGGNLTGKIKAQVITTTAADMTLI